MTPLRSLLSLGAVALLAGCPSASVRFPPDLWEDWTPVPTGFPTPTGFIDDTAVEPSSPEPIENPGRVDQATTRCTPGQQWLMEVTTLGWANGATGILRGADGVSEHHPMAILDTDPNGQWDRYQAGPLASSEPAESVVLGTSSRFDCTATDLPYGVITLDRLGAVADCVVWGDDRIALMNELLVDLPVNTTCRSI